jgi:hypothetical protein
MQGESGLDLERLSGDCVVAFPVDNGFAFVVGVIERFGTTHDVTFTNLNAYVPFSERVRCAKTRAVSEVGPLLTDPDMRIFCTSAIAISGADDVTAWLIEEVVTVKERPSSLDTSVNGVVSGQIQLQFIRSLCDVKLAARGVRNRCGDNMRAELHCRCMDVQNCAIFAQSRPTDINFNMAKRIIFVTV